jgi:hypothetical protein
VRQIDVRAIEKVNALALQTIEARGHDANRQKSAVFMLTIT